MINKLKCGKVACVYGITAEMLEYGEETVVEFMCLIYDLAWIHREVPDEWKVIIVPLHKWKGSKDECKNHRDKLILLSL